MGSDNLNNLRFSLLTTKIQKGCEKATSRAADKVAEALKQLLKRLLNVSASTPSRDGEVPHKVSGTLRDSIFIAARTMALVVRLFLRTAFYGKMLEDGTGGMRGKRPFKEISAEEMKKQLPSLLKIILTEELKVSLKEIK